ncbi:hypothetical protein ACFWCF_19060 [Rhodococcus sp. NPDC060090]|uniref:hypothetical protein n=1 Tax=Rhodococcus sp. NPDC060090 TaxID=3347056 RepID=UPI00365EFAC6
MYGPAQGPELPETQVGHRIVEHEREFAKRVAWVILTTCCTYVVLWGMFQWFRFTSADNSAPAFVLALAWGDALTLLAVIATLIVATNVTAWLPSLADAESWKWFARRRSANTANGILGLIAACTLPATVLHSYPDNMGTGTLLTCLAAVVIIGVAIDGTFAVDPKNALQLQVRKAEISSKIERLSTNANDRSSSAALKKRKVRTHVLQNLSVIVLLTAVPMSLGVALHAWISDVDVHLLQAAAGISIAALASTVGAVYVAFTARLLWDTRQFTNFALQASVGVLIYLIAGVSAVEVLWSDTPLVTTTRMLVALIAILVPLTLVLLGTNQTRTLGVVLRAPRVLIDRALDRTIRKLEIERDHLPGDLAMRIILLPGTATVRASSDDDRHVRTNTQN